jgi:cation diffusion facilitator CzcD-associated flavoprotein CzcO
MSPANKYPHHKVVVVGAGFSGLLCTRCQKEAGIEDVCLLEKNASVDGVWSYGGVGAYPGVACDVPAYTYLPFLDRTGFIPSKKYFSQQEIASYAELLSDHCDIREKMHFNRKVIELRCINDGERVWQVTTEDAIRGESSHTAQWDASANLKGKRMGVIGTGASAAQVITAICDDIEHLIVFQRTPTWCLPRDDEPTPPEMIERFKADGYSEALRYVDWKGNCRQQRWLSLLMICTTNSAMRQFVPASLNESNRA